MTIIPKVTKPNSGITLARGTWRYLVTENGKKRYRSLRTSDVELARIKRDDLYASLQATGATVSRTPESIDRLRHSIDPTHPTRYIHKVHVRQPYKVVIGGTVIGHYPTRDAAIAARNAALGLTGGAA